MGVLSKKQHLPTYHLAEAHELYEAATSKFLQASDAFVESAAARKARIAELTALLTAEHQDRDHELQQSERALDIAEHLAKL